MMFLFMPLETVAGSTGLPNGVALFKDLARERHIERLPMTDKTLRKALSPQTHTPKTSEKLTRVIEQFGIRNFTVDVPSEVKGTRLFWHQWLELADNLPADFLPRSRDYVREFARHEREVVQGLGRCRPTDYKRAAAQLTNNRFTCRLCTEISAKNVSRQIPVLSTKEDYVRFLNNNTTFLRWLTHCRVSLLMDILALADIEYSKNHILSESATAQKLRSVSMVAPILPRFRDKKLMLPIPLLLERLKEGKRIRLWKQLAVYIHGVTKPEEKCRMLRRWRSGKRVPTDYSIRRFLENCVRHEESRNTLLRRYRIALLLTGLHAWVKKILPDVTDEQCLQMFHTFHRHRKRHFCRLRRFQRQAG